MGIPVNTILDRKGHEVGTIAPGSTLTDALAELRRFNVGALVVSQDDRHVEGVVSERDIVRRLAETGADALQETVGSIMSADVTVCDRSTSTDDLIVMMTERRIRHVPVVHDGALVGIVSIGDIVKWRMEELADEAKQLEGYVTGSY